MPPEGLESSVDGLGRPVRAVGVVEEREDVRHAAFEGASERGEFGASGRTAFDGEGFDELGHHAPSLAPVLVRVAGDDLLVRAVREGERLVRGVGEQIVGARLLPVGAQGRGLEQDPPALVERPWCRAGSPNGSERRCPRRSTAWRRSAWIPQGPHVSDRGPTHGPQGPALPFMAARGTAAPARAPPSTGPGES